MTDEELSLEDTLALLSGDRHKSVTVEVWPGKDALLEIRKAALDGEIQVDIKGKTHVVWRYKDTDYYFVSPVKGFVPCGCFEIGSEP